jgi:hypothetical protein
MFQSMVFVSPRFAQKNENRRTALPKGATHRLRKLYHIGREEATYVPGKACQGNIKTAARVWVARKRIKTTSLKPLAPALRAR